MSECRLVRWLGCLFLSAGPAFAVTLEVDFSTLDLFEESESTGVWNTVLHRLHVPFVIDKDEDGDEDETLIIGNGSDGVFNADTVSQFDENATSTLVTLDSSRTYQFTSLTLPHGMTLTATGLDPLVIYVLGDVRIQGTIALDGADGADGASDVSSSPSGGAAGSGGGAGGAGGSTSQVAQDGVGSDTDNLSRGRAGSEGTGANTSGGGGGGGLEDDFKTADAGTAGSGGAGGAGGAAGADVSNTELNPFIGGGGGGGGARHQGPSAGSGGGGGGGGGALKIFSGGSIIISANGVVQANGGNGGDTAGTLNSGGGGGGAGGQIYLAAADLLTNSGAIFARSGDGGSAPSGGVGGAGGFGRTRLVDETSVGWKGNDPSGTEDPQPGGADFGRVFPTLESVVIVSKVIDTKNTSPTYVSAEMETVLNGSDRAILEVAGSHSGFDGAVDGDTGFVAASEISSLNGYRWFRFRIILTAGSRSTEPYVSSLTIEYDNRVANQFTFDTASCARVHPPTDGSRWGGLLVWGYLIILPWLTRFCWQSSPVVRGRDSAA